MSKYAVISGETPSELRDKIIQIFNSDENMRGELIKVILVSKTGQLLYQLRPLNQLQFKK
jgi:superfamily II DNA or RNA helicase